MCRHWVLKRWNGEKGSGREETGRGGETIKKWRCKDGKGAVWFQGW